MHYINDSNTKAKTYKQLVDACIKYGIEPQKAYIYLAGLGIRGGMTRVMLPDDNGYDEPEKYAMRGKNTLIHTIKTCDHCGSLVIK